MKIKAVKEFFKPDWKKIILVFILLTGIVIIIPIFYSCLGCYNTAIGLPLFFYEQINWPLSERKTNFSISNFGIDIIFWYLFSCLIVWIYNKVKKKWQK